MVWRYQLCILYVCTCVYVWSRTWACAALFLHRARLRVRFLQSSDEGSEYSRDGSDADDGDWEDGENFKSCSKPCAGALQRRFMRPGRSCEVDFMLLGACALSQTPQTAALGIPGFVVCIRLQKALDQIVRT